jgi:hypothetical protein
MPIRRSPNGAGYTRPQPGRDRPEWVVAINRNAWSQSIGTSGRNQSERARIVMLRALNRNVERFFIPDRKEPHWGKRKLKRDQ